MVSLENRDLGSGPRFMVVDPGVHYQGPLPGSTTRVHYQGPLPESTTFSNFDLDLKSMKIPTFFRKQNQWQNLRRKYCQKYPVPRNLFGQSANSAKIFKVFLKSSHWVSVVPACILWYCICFLSRVGLDLVRVYKLGFLTCSWSYLINSSSNGETYVRLRQRFVSSIGSIEKTMWVLAGQKISAILLNYPTFEVQNYSFCTL